MDRRFLSQKDVIAASRNFVCVRMMTYESASEAQILRSLWRPGVELENTVFAILDPDGRPILRGGRGPEHVFVDAREMADTMNQIAAYYRLAGGAGRQLPSIETLRLGLNVAACDRRPLAVVVAETETERRQLAQRLSDIAWSDTFIGKLVYSSARTDELRKFTGANLSSGFAFIQANEFGTAGSIICQMGSEASGAELELCTKQAIAGYKPSGLQHHEHVRMGKQMGIEWKSAIPVTDPHALRAQEMHRGRGQYRETPPTPPPY